MVLNYLHADHLGRPAFATDTAGEIVWDGGITTPFGVQIETMGALTQNLMFPGQYEDEETGFYYNWHRTYDPTLGRYLQSDPIGLAGGLNRYAYVGGNPMGYVDPEGLTFIQSDRNGYAPDSANLAANIAEAAAMKDKPLCQKLKWFYNKVNYGEAWDYKSIRQSNRRYNNDKGYNPDFENFGNWHYGVVGAAAGFSPAVLTNAAGLAQIKNGSSKLEYYQQNTSTCHAECQPWVRPFVPDNWDDPNDQYWIRKGIRDFRNNNTNILRGSDYRANSVD